MNCKIKLADWVADIIREQPEAVRKAVEKQLLVDLPANPSLLGEPVMFPYAHIRSYPVNCSASPQVWLVFRVDTGVPGELHVVSVQVVQGPPPASKWTQHESISRRNDSGPTVC